MTAHPPITITSDADFVIGTHGVVSGSGTDTDPYVIENWEIDGAGGTSAISVQNTKKFFVIRNCAVFNADSGIILDGVKNGTLTSNNCSNNKNEGILLVKSQFCTVMNNTCDRNGINGISLTSFSGNSSIAVNMCRDNGQNGIAVYDSTNLTMQSNTCTGHMYHGINIMDSAGISVISNTVWNNRQNGIVLTDCSDVQIEGNSCTYHTMTGIVTFLSSRLTIRNNVCSNNYEYGMRIHSTTASLIELNICRSNYYIGIFLDLQAKNNRVVNNTIEFNQYGIVLDRDSSYNEISYCYVANNMKYAAYCNKSHFNRFHHNNFTSNHLGFKQGKDMANNNFWNASDIGNWWSDWLAPDSDRNGVVDSPYVLDGTGGAKDYLPKAAPVIVPDGIPALSICVIVFISVLCSAFRRTVSH